MCVRAWVYILNGSRYFASNWSKRIPPLSYFLQTNTQTNSHEDKFVCAGPLPATLPTVYSLTAWALLKGGSLTVLTCKPLREERLETGLFMPWTPKEHLQKKLMIAVQVG